MVCIIVCDNGNPSKCDTINLPVTIIDITPTPGPAAPIVIPTPIVTEPGTPITVCMPIIDTPADTHTGTICNPVSAKGSTYFAVDNTNHTVCFTYRPAPGMVGKDEICMIICDQTNKCDTVKIPVTINPPIGPPTSNQPPVVVPTPIVTESNKPVTICTSIQDPNTSDTHTSVLCSTPLNGSATTSINNTTNQVCVTYSPKPNFSGNDEVCIIVCDQTGRCDTIKFPITVKPVVVLKRPTIYAYNDNNITTKTASVSGNVLINDDIATGTLPLIVNTVPVTQPMYGTVTLDANGRYTYTPNGTYVGIDTFKYQVCDNNRAASCDTATVTINIIDFSTTSNNPPIALGDNLSTRENIIVSGNVLSNDRDPDSGQTLTVSLVNGPTNGQLTLNPDGTYTYKPNPGFVGNDKFTYKVCDNGTPQMCSNAIVDLNVYGANVINLPPIANADLFFRCPTCSATGTILTNDSDPEGGVLVLNTMPITPPSNGSVSINSNGTFTYTPNPGFTGPDKFVYEVCDNYSPKLCSQAVVFIIPKNNVIGNADLSISKTVIGPKNREINDLITYKIVVRNLGPDAATNVIVKDSVTTSLVLMSGTTTNGTFSSPLWSISSIASGDSAILTVTAKVIAEGVSFNYAIIKNSDQIDNNKINNTTNSCISVPYKLCSGQLIEVSVPSNYLNVVWRDAQGNVVPSVGNNVSLTKAGVYSFSASNNTCPNGGCCPVIVVDSNDCCPANLCIPFTVQKKRR